VDQSQTLAGFTIDWLTRFLRQQQELYPVQFTPTFEADDLTANKKLTVSDLVEFTAYQDWRFVGSQGQPAFTAGWVNYGNPYANASFLLGPDGFVSLHGVIKSGTVGSVAFTLPPGYRPAALHSLLTLSNGAAGRVDIDTTGTVTPISPSSNASVVLDGLRFKAA